jgi:hypothetical protein
MKNKTISIAERISHDSGKIRAALEAAAWLMKKRTGQPIWDIQKPGAIHSLTLIYANNAATGGQWSVCCGYPEGESDRLTVQQLVDRALAPKPPGKP